MFQNGRANKKKILEYFQHEWLESNPNWFEGVSKLVPSTNNALESFNRVIKDENTLRERLPLSRFAVILKEYINTWSLQYTANAKTMHAVPTLNLGLWTKAYQWANEKKKRLSRMLHPKDMFISFLLAKVMTSQI